jgi:lysosomal Pro-X carboxypeptidase
MWELAERHNALLVFAEHRYYGKWSGSLCMPPSSPRGGLPVASELPLLPCPSAAPTHPPTHSLTPAPAGQSKPFPPKVLRKHMAWLTSEQAMADYATLIWELKEELQDPDVPVIGFGG